MKESNSKVKKKTFSFPQASGNSQKAELQKIIIEEFVKSDKVKFYNWYNLNDKILNLITEPGTSIFSWADFQNKIPIEEREKIDPDQFKYKNEIIKITSKVLE